MCGMCGMCGICSVCGICRVRPKCSVCPKCYTPATLICIPLSRKQNHGWNYLNATYLKSRTTAAFQTSPNRKMCQTSFLRRFLTASVKRYSIWPLRLRKSSCAHAESSSNNVFESLRGTCFLVLFWSCSAITPLYRTHYINISNLR